MFLVLCLSQRQLRIKQDRLIKDKTNAIREYVSKKVREVSVSGVGHSFQFFFFLFVVGSEFFGIHNLHYTIFICVIMCLYVCVCVCVCTLWLILRFITIHQNMHMKNHVYDYFSIYPYLSLSFMSLNDMPVSWQTAAFAICSSDGFAYIRSCTESCFIQFCKNKHPSVQ